MPGTIPGYPTRITTPGTVHSASQPNNISHSTLSLPWHLQSDLRPISRILPPLQLPFPTCSRYQNESRCFDEILKKYMSASSIHTCLPTLNLPSLSPPPPMTPSLLALYRRPFGELQGFSPPRGLITPGDQVFDNAIPVETTSSGLGSGSTSVNLPLSGLSPAPVTACSTLVASPDGSFVAPVLPVCVRQPAELDAERHHIRKQLKTLRKSPYPIISKKPQANAISPVTSLDCMELSTEQKRPHQLAPRTSALKAPRKPPKFTRAVAPHLCPDFKHPTKSVRRTWTEDRINVLLEAARQFHRDWKVLDPWDQRHRSSFTDELYIRCRDIWREWFPTEDFIMTCQGLKDYVGKKDTEDLRSLSGIPALILMDEQKALEEVALRAQVASMQIAKHRVV